MPGYVCIHGHFYQPPRENPWLEYVEVQDSAYPYHDWNERVTAECYRPNTASQVLDANGLVAAAVNNYAHISFNMGPTLLSWLERHDRFTYQRILAADAESAGRFGGHGSAMAQAYNHLIMPLANRRDKTTQVVWGIADFQHRYGRRPEGMWLPETAVDLESLDIMAEHGVRFTVLAPHQAAQFRPLAGGDWQPVHGTIDPTRAYLQRLPSGRSIAVFFYDGPVSHDVAFADLLTSGERFAGRLTAAFTPQADHPQLVHIASDGETYGHHRRFADMALAYTVRTLEHWDHVRLTNYGEYLELHPPAFEVEIAENTSWSCTHGVERWRADCGCNTGGNPGWHQQWRAPLRQTLDWLRDDLAELYEQAAGPLVRDVWAARDAYIAVILDRSPDTWASFEAAHAARPLDDAERVGLRKLLEMQRNALLMFTSCGWFFDDISGIEATQVLLYAGRAAELANEIDGGRRDLALLRRLAEAPSNDPDVETGSLVFRNALVDARVNAERALAHRIVARMLNHDAPDDFHTFAIDLEGVDEASDGHHRALTGAADVTSTLTGEAVALQFAATANGPEVTVAVRRAEGDGDGHHHGAIEDHSQYDGGLRPEAAAALLDEEPDETQLRFEGEYDRIHTLATLCRDEGRHLLRTLLDEHQTAAGHALQQVFSRYRPLRAGQSDRPQPLPGDLRPAVAAALHHELRQVLAADDQNAFAVQRLVRAARLWEAPLDVHDLGYRLTQTTDRLALAWQANPADGEAAHRLLLAVLLSTAPETPFRANLWLAQTVCLRVLADPPAPSPDADDAAAWQATVQHLASQLRVTTVTPTPAEA